MTGWHRRPRGEGEAPLQLLRVPRAEGGPARPPGRDLEQALQPPPAGRHQRVRGGSDGTEDAAQCRTVEERDESKYIPSSTVEVQTHPDGTFKLTSVTNLRKNCDVYSTWHSNDMFHYVFKPEFVTLVSLKVPSGCQITKIIVWWNIFYYYRVIAELAVI